MMQNMSRIGAYLKTGSDFAQLGCLLEDCDIMPACKRLAPAVNPPIPAPAMRILCLVTQRSYRLSILYARIPLPLFLFHLRVVAKNALLVKGQSPR